MTWLKLLPEEMVQSAIAFDSTASGVSSPIDPVGFLAGLHHRVQDKFDFFERVPTATCRRRSLPGPYAGSPLRQRSSYLDWRMFFAHSS